MNHKFNGEGIINSIETANIIVPSNLDKHWEVKPRTVDDLVEQLLLNRGIKDPDKFFNPDFERDSHDPFLLPGMKITVERILKAIELKEQIAIFGDYDADGIPGTALLVKTLRANQAEPIYYLPDREKEGYGLNLGAIDWLAEQGTKIIITVDLGIGNKKQVAYAKDKGIDVIVTDHHHISQEKLPIDAYALIHPRLEGSAYPFGQLAGGGVAWKLAQAIHLTTGSPNIAQLKWWLELPAISTVCDVVPLSDENRMIVTFGLKVLSQSRNLGLRALYKAGGITPENINEGTIGFQIGPRINAPGRVGHGSLALELLLAEDPMAAAAIASKIELQNRERQAKLEELVDEALERIYRDKLYEQEAIVLVGKDWPIGLIGLAAARIVEKVNRPVLLLEEFADGTAKGSGRSIGSFSLVEAIEKLKDLLIEGGGHDKAAGLHLKLENLGDFTKEFIKLAKQKLTKEELIPSLVAEMEIGPEEITPELVRQVLSFAPFGLDNPRPRFLIRPLTIKEIRSVGVGGKHLKIRLRENNLELIGFNLGFWASQLLSGQEIEVMGRLEFNHWHQNDDGLIERIQIVAEDIKLIRS